MLIKLKWSNKNDSSAVIQVYRSTAPIDTAAPGTPLATLLGTASEYSDNTAVSGTTYYYAVAVSKGVNKLFTPVKVFDNVYHRGPGGDKIIYGDERFGYYGTVATDNFIDVCKILGLSATFSALYRFTWHKFCRKGKVIYVADRPLFSNVLATSVYAHAVRKTVGLVSGLVWNFDNSAWIDSKKTSINDFGGDKFHFRALRGLPDDWDGSTPTPEMVSNPTTEFNEIIQCLTTKELYFPSKVGTVRTGTVVAPQMNKIICAEKVGTTSLSRELQASSIQTAAWTTLSSKERTKAAFVNFSMRNDLSVDPTAVSLETWSSIWPVFELID